MVKEEDLTLRPNVPKDHEAEARTHLAGYYAHIAALDDCVGDLLKTLKECDLEEDTIFVFTSDHGDMLHSQGVQKKQWPYDESIMVPFLLRYPAVFGKKGGTFDMPIDAPDLMPTLLGLSNIGVPDTVEGADFSRILKGEEAPSNDAVLITCPWPFGQWTRAMGGKEYRGVRTRRYTYVRDLNGPWLLFDNQEDPYQLVNLCDKPEQANLQKQLDLVLAKKLKDTNDAFLPGQEYVDEWGYTLRDNGAVPYW